MNLEDIKANLIYKFNAEVELTQAIEEISYKFNHERNKIGDYLNDPKLVAAYSCFYLTTNMPKLAEVFNLIQFPIEKLDEYEFVDIGCGPGTFVLSLLQLNNNLKIQALEKSELMIEQAKQFVARFYPAADVQIFNNIQRIKKKEKKRIAIFGHSANEMETEQVLNIIKTLDCDNVLFIEPGTKLFFQKMLDIRTSLIDQEYNILFPCKSAHTCPMNEKDWCHQFIRISHDYDVERLTQLVNRDRKLLPLTVQYFSKQESIQESDKVRVVRVYRPTKHSVEWQVCSHVNDENQIFDLQIMGRGMNKSDFKALHKKMSGEEISFEVEKNLGSNKIRGKLK